MEEKFTLRSLIVIHFVIFVADFTFRSGTTAADALAGAIMMSISFIFATVVSIAMSKAPLWILLTTGILGLGLLSTGIYYSIEEPDGILTPLLITIGFGILLATIITGGNRYWKDRHV